MRHHAQGPRSATRSAGGNRRTRFCSRSTAGLDSGGAENGDKCAWTFNVPYVTFRDGSEWKIQGEWSDAAYNAGKGYPDSAGQDERLDGDSGNEPPSP